MLIHSKGLLHLALKILNGTLGHVYSDSRFKESGLELTIPMLTLFADQIQD